MISLSRARALIARHIHPLPARREPLEAALGRVLRESVRSREPLPPFDRSAVDGYCVNGIGQETCFRVTGEIPAGKQKRLRLRRGEAARIFTGGPVPAGTTRVVMQEQVERRGDTLHVPTGSRGDFIRRRGEDSRRGDLLLSAGQRLGPVELSLLASVGITRPRVSPAVRVLHLVTGNEIIPPDRTPCVGQIRDSNGPLVAGFVRRFGGELVRQVRLADDLDGMIQAVREADDGMDLLLVSGGAGPGDHDFGRRLLLKLGFKIHFDRLNSRPGKPLIFGVRQRQAAFVLPGNPVAHFVTLHVEVLAAFSAFGMAPAKWNPVHLPLASACKGKSDPRPTLWPARLKISGGVLTVEALRWQSSGDMTGLAGADALLLLPGGSELPHAGDMVSTLILLTGC